MRSANRTVCMLAYSAYEGDNRIRRYAETLVRRGDTVHVIAISAPHLEQAREAEINGVKLYRVQHREQNERSKWTYAWRLLRFLFVSSRALIRLHRENQYDVIHIHNIPDFLVFAAWYPRLCGAKLILDIHDLTPELFAAKFNTRLAKAYVWILKLVEAASARFVDHIIVSNHLWLTTVTKRSAPATKCSVFLNLVDPDLFFRRQKTRLDPRFIILFPGSLQWHQGLDIAISAFSEFKRRVPAAEFHLYAGSGGDMEESLRKLARQLGVEASVRFLRGVPLDDMPEIIANADLGVVPKRADSFGNEAYSTKILEFMSQGVPVVVARTKIDSYYFEEGTVHFFTAGDSHAMAESMLDIFSNDALRASLVARGLEYCDANGWSQKKVAYLRLIDSLSAQNGRDALGSSVDGKHGEAHRPNDYRVKHGAVAASEDGRTKPERSKRP